MDALDRREALCQDGQGRPSADHLAVKQAAGLSSGSCCGDPQTGQNQLNETVELTAAIRQEDGIYWAEVPDMPGLFATGDTLDELTEALMEAYVLYVNDGPGDLATGAGPSERPEPAEIKLRVPVPA